MKKLSLLLLGGTALLVSAPALASNTATISQVGDDGYLVVAQDTQGSGSAIITQAGLRNQIQVDQTEGLHNPPGDHNPPGYRNAATIVQEGRDNAINHGLLLPAVHPGQNNTVAGGVVNNVDLRQGGFNNAIGYSQSGQGHDIHFVQGGNGQSARITQSGEFDGVNGHQDGALNFSTIEQSGKFDRVNFDQPATDSRLTVFQYGDLDFANVTQTGQNNTFVAFQQGNGATALVTQGGTGNFTQISH